MKGFIIDTNAEINEHIHDFAAFVLGTSMQESNYLNAHCFVEGVISHNEDTHPIKSLEEPYSLVSTPDMYLTSKHHIYHIDDEDIALIVYNDFKINQLKAAIEYMNKRKDLGKAHYKEENFIKFNREIDKIKEKIEIQKVNKIIEDKKTVYHSLSLNFEDDTIFNEELLEMLKNRAEEFCFIKNITVLSFRLADYKPTIKYI
jgi:hypothetical protein